MKKNILVVDDSALMRRVLCDIIQSDDGFLVEDIAKDGLEALELLKKKKYDAVILDINMPNMTGLELLEAMKKDRIRAKVIIASTISTEGAAETLQALELGAVDFVTKPGNFIEARGLGFKELLLQTLEAAFHATPTSVRATTGSTMVKTTPKTFQPQPAKTSVSKVKGVAAGNKVVALACSTGGPKSLQSVLPFLPKNLDAPVLLVQHMPAGFTAALAGRLNDMSQVTVKEAEDGEELVKGCVYIAPGGKHLKCVKSGSGHRIAISDEPPRDALKPCANIMYESLIDCGFSQITCVVLTGMGADGTKGIKKLAEKKKLYVIGQDKASCVVYGMPRAIAETGLVDKVATLTAIADEITKNVGVY